MSDHYSEAVDMIDNIERQDPEDLSIDQQLRLAQVKALLALVTELSGLRHGE